MSKKIRVTIPTFITKVIKSDAEDFGFTLNGFCNEIFSIYAKEKKELEPIQKSKNNEVIQFNLNIANEDLYVSTLRMYGIQVETEFFKRILYNYIDMPKYKRERIIFSETVKKIEYAGHKELKVEVKYKNEVRVIEPYFIKYAGGESRNYIHAYSEKSKGYRNYRLTAIKVLRILEEKQEYNNNEYLENIKNNFDPFLSYGFEIKVKLTELGINHYKTVITNRPEIKEINGNVYTFHCSPENAKIYFPHFLDSAEIIEPRELREWFKEKFENVVNKYKNYEIQEGEQL